MEILGKWDIHCWMLTQMWYSIRQELQLRLPPQQNVPLDTFKNLIFQARLRQVASTRANTLF